MKRLSRSQAFIQLRRNWPYVLIMVLVPGGSLIAPLLLAVERSRKRNASPAAGGPLQMSTVAQSGVGV